MIIITKIILIQSDTNNNNNNNNKNNNNNVNDNNNDNNNNNNYIVIMIAMIIVITTDNKFKTFSSFLFICQKCFTKRSYLVCFVHLSDIKPNRSSGIQLVYPTPFCPLCGLSR